MSAVKFIVLSDGKIGVMNRKKQFLQIVLPKVMPFYFLHHNILLIVLPSYYKYFHPSNNPAVHLYSNPTHLFYIDF